MKAQLTCLALGLALFFPAHAERADRDKPMLLEANKVTIDDAKKLQILEGDVILSKGTLVLRAEKIIISEDSYGFQRGTAFSSKNGLARFRQKREGKDEYVEGQAERIEYNSRTEVAELFHRAWAKSGDDEIRGDYIWYDAVSEKYMASAGERRSANEPQPRVRAIIQPRARGDMPATTETGTGSEQLRLRGAGSLELGNHQGLDRN